MRWQIGTIALALGLAEPALAVDEVTYTKHVAPIVWKNCAGCHRPGEVGPFSLLTYQDAAKRADFIRDITANHRMPPWKPAPGFGEFRDSRRLSDDEVALLAKWANSGAKEGNLADLPPPPKFPEGWQLGEPDVVLKMPGPFRVPAGGRDIHRCFIIPIPIDADKDVAAVEFRPGNRRVVHHSILYLDHTGAARKRDREDGLLGYGTFGSPGIVPTGGLGAWAPGVMPRFLPEGIGRFLKKGSDLVLQIHYHPTGKDEEDQSMVGLHFAKRPVEKYVAGIAAASRGLYIPAGAKRHVITAQSEAMPADVQAMAISPHMHLLGKEFKVTAAQPDGTTVPLIWIKDWDFNWQGTYQYAKPVKLPKGTVFHIETVYDNSADNPKNPNNPPRPVRWGEQTTDEMCLCVVQVVTDTMADLRKVAALRGARLGSAIDGGLPPDIFPKIDMRNEVAIPPGGITIPDPFKDLLGKYDKNTDGKLTADEIEAMPAPLRAQVLEVVRRLPSAPAGAKKDK